MAVYNANWPRWIRASAQDYLEDVVTDNPTVFNAGLTEGFDERGDDPNFETARLRAEIRFTGPFTVKHTANYWSGRCFANVLCAMKLGQQGDRYDLDKATGLFAQAMDSPITINRCGNGPDDDDSFLGCLSTVDSNASPVRVVDLGVVDVTDRQRQALVTATFFIELSN